MIKYTTSDDHNKKILSPEFSIIICTYNQADSLKNTLSSINKSTNISTSNIELIVIINNSTDNTLEICRDFEPISVFPFRHFIEKKQGLSYARNQGIQKSAGNILIFTDDDVIVPRNWLYTIIESYHTESPDCVFGKILPEWKGNKPEWFSPPMSTAYALLNYGNRKLDIRTNEKEFFGANFSIKKSILEDIGGFNIELGRKGEKLLIGEETQIFRHLIINKRKIIYNPDCHLLHVIHESRKTKSFIKKYYSDIADSIFYMENKNSNRNLFGMPLYKYKHFFSFYISYIPKYLFFSLVRNKNKKFILYLNLIKNNRLINLYFNNLTNSILK